MYETLKKGVEQKAKSKRKICQQYRISSSKLLAILLNLRTFWDSFLQGSSGTKRKRSNYFESVDEILCV